MTVTLAGRYDDRIVRADRRRVAARVGHYGNPLNDALRALGLLGCRSHDKFIPRAYLDADRESRLDLLRGLLDTDGWVERWGSVRLSTASERLAADVAALVRSLGGWCSITSKRPHFRGATGERREGRRAFVCHIAHPQPSDLLLLSEKAVRLAASRRRAKRPTFASIEPDGRAPVQCISVSHTSRLYVTDDYVVTHNTAFSLNIAEFVAVEQRLPVAVFSMEMSGSQLAMRLLGSIGRLDQHKLRTARLSDEDWGRLTNAVEKLHDAPIHIDETPALNALELRARSRRLHRQYGKLGLIVIDYLQLMSASSVGENRATEISEISRSLKALAKELHVPVIALSQLNRSLEQRPNKRPVMSDLRECVTGDTLVLCADGRRAPIASLVGTQPEVWAVDESGKLLAARAEAVWSVGVRRVHRLHLASGRSLVATDRHRVLTGTGWKTLGELAVGARVALARKVPEPLRATAEWTDEQVVLLGHLVGDGSYLTHQPLRYTTASDENCHAVRRAAEALGSIVTRHAGRGAWHQLVIAGNGNRWHSAGVGRWLKDLGIFGQRSHEKRLPSAVFGLSDRQIGVLLRHLWATDGFISLRKPGQKGAARVYFSTCSRGLADDVAALLLRLGIVARLRSVHSDGARAVWTVDVSGSEAQRNFVAKIGGFGPRAAPAEALARELQTRAAGTNVDTLPREAFVDVRARTKAAGVSTRAMAALRGTSYGGSAHFELAPSRDMMREYAVALHDPKLAAWSESDLFLDTVVRLEAAGEQEVFDLTVPGPASWLADGIVSHNSGAIEQDADVIFFIYRDEVYNPDTADKGKAEIIIGKQRNGPIGSIDLTFLGQHTRFENYAAPNRF
jgi:replicative DNA helicase